MSDFDPGEGWREINEREWLQTPIDSDSVDAIIGGRHRRWVREALVPPLPAERERRNPMTETPLPENAPPALFVDAHSNVWQDGTTPNSLAMVRTNPDNGALPWPLVRYEPVAVIPAAAHGWDVEERPGQPGENEPQRFLTSLAERHDDAVPPVAALPSPTDPGWSPADPGQVYPYGVPTMRINAGKPGIPDRWFIYKPEDAA